MQRMARTICPNETGWKYAEESDRLKTKTWSEIFRISPVTTPFMDILFKVEIVLEQLSSIM